MGPFLPATENRAALDCEEPLRGAGDAHLVRITSMRNYPATWRDLQEQARSAPTHSASPKSESVGQSRFRPLMFARATATISHAFVKPKHHWMAAKLTSGDAMIRYPPPVFRSCGRDRRRLNQPSPRSSGLGAAGRRVFSWSHTESTVADAAPSWSPAHSDSPVGSSPKSRPRYPHRPPQLIGWLQQSP